MESYDVSRHGSSTFHEFSPLNTFLRRFHFTTEQMLSTLRKFSQVLNHSRSGVNQAGYIGPPGTYSSMLRPMPGRHRPDTTMPEPLDVDYCPYPLNFDCSDFIQYRSIEGSCNNLNHPLIGRSMTPFRRLVPTHYADGL